MTEGSCERFVVNLQNSCLILYLHCDFIKSSLKQKTKMSIKFMCDFALLRLFNLSYYLRALLTSKIKMNVAELWSPEVTEIKVNRYCIIF